MGKASGSLDIRTLVEQHYRLLYRYAYRLTGSVADAEDLTQETFCTAQVKLGQLRDPARVVGWLCAILRNHHLQRVRRAGTTPIESLDDLAVEVESPDELPADVDPERLQHVLAEMPEPFRTPVILFYFDELSYREIAREMRVPMGTVMSRLARGKAYLRARLRPELCVSHPEPSRRAN